MSDAASQPFYQRVYSSIVSFTARHSSKVVTAVHWGWMPLVIYLGFTTEPKARVADIFGPQPQVDPATGQPLPYDPSDPNSLPPPQSAM